MYAIVDIETTGGYAAHHKITEIAIYHHDGKQVTGHYHSLINPKRPIPKFITGLTGIDDNMVSTAPSFQEIASEIYEQLTKRIFVAHNAHFDYSFLKKEFDLVNISWAPKKLDTVRLSRKIFPGLPSYGLGRLAEHLGIQITSRHRAAGDAKATTTIFDLLLKNDQDGVISKSLRRNSGEMVLPPHLSKEAVMQLPTSAGVYYFKDHKGRVIYVGKAINIKKRVASHFSGVAKEWNRSSIRNEIHQISFELTGNEFIALLLESQEISRLWPKYNLAQKNKSVVWGITEYEDQLGYSRWCVTQTNKNITPLIRFNSKGDAWNYCWEIVREFELCPKLCGLQTSKGMCFSHQTGTCKGACSQIEPASTYNKRVQQAKLSIVESEASYAIVGVGRKPSERSVVLIEKGTYIGYGFASSRRKFSSLNVVKKIIEPAKFNRMHQNIVNSFLFNPKDQKIIILK